MSNGYIGPYSPEWYDADTSTDVSVQSSDAQASVGVPWYQAVTGVIGAIGKTATGIMQTAQGVYVDQYGRVVASKGEPVYNYNPTGALGGLIGGTSLTTLLLLGLGVLLVLKLAK